MKSFGLYDPKIAADLKREIDLMKRLRSPFIVTFLGAVVFL